MKKSKKIALSGISAAFAAIFLILGNYISLLDYSFYLLASLCLMLPFVTGEVLWGVLSFLAATGIGMIFAPNLTVMMAFFAFFGPYAVLTEILNMKRVILWLSLIIKNVFYAASITVLYFFSQFFVEINEWALPLWVLIVGAFVVMNVYDFLMVRIIRQLEKIVVRIMNKG